MPRGNWIGTIRKTGGRVVAAIVNRWAQDETPAASAWLASQLSKTQIRETLARMGGAGLDGAGRAKVRTAYDLDVDILPDRKDWGLF